MGLPGGTVVKNPPAYAGDERDADSTPRSGRSPGRGNGNPLQYSLLENLMDRGVWRATVHDVTKSQTRLSNWAHTCTHTPSVCQARDQALRILQNRTPPKNPFPVPLHCDLLYMSDSFEPFEREKMPDSCSTSLTCHCGVNSSYKFRVDWLLGCRDGLIPQAGGWERQLQAQAILSPICLLLETELVYFLCSARGTQMQRKKPLLPPKVTGSTALQRGGQCSASLSPWACAPHPLASPLPPPHQLWCCFLLARWQLLQSRLLEQFPPLWGLLSSWESCRSCLCWHMDLP